MFDLVDLYQDFQGAMCVLAPNPVFRSLEKSHIEPPNISSAETVAYKIITRHEQVVTGLSLEIVNEHRWGRALTGYPQIRQRGDHCAQLSDAALHGREIYHPSRVRAVVLASTGSPR